MKCRINACYARQNCLIEIINGIAYHWRGSERNFSSLFATPNWSVFRQWRVNASRKNAARPRRIRLNVLDNGANFGSLPFLSPGQKARKSREMFYLLWGSFLSHDDAPPTDGGISFLRASYFRVHNNKVSLFDKTSSHEFPATRRLRTSTTRDEGKSVFCRIRRKARGGYLVFRAENARKFLLMWGTAERRVGLSSFPMRWLEYLTVGFLRGEGICLAFGRLSQEVNGNAKLG